MVFNLIKLPLEEKVVIQLFSVNHRPYFIPHHWPNPNLKDTAYSCILDHITSFVWKKYGSGKSSNIFGMKWNRYFNIQHQCPISLMLQRLKGSKSLKSSPNILWGF